MEAFFLVHPSVHLAIQCLFLSQVFMMLENFSMASLDGSNI